VLQSTTLLCRCVDIVNDRLEWDVPCEVIKEIYLITSIVLFCLTGVALIICALYFMTLRKTGVNIVAELKQRWRLLSKGEDVSNNSSEQELHQVQHASPPGG